MPLTQDADVIYATIDTRSNVRCAHAPRSFRVPTRSTPGSPTANAFPFPTRSGSAALLRTLLSSLSESCPTFVPAAPHPLRPIRNTSSIDPPGPNQSSVSALEKFLLCFVATVLIFFIAGLLYLLRFERVDNLGAYRIPPETGILIPSVFAIWCLFGLFRI
jgi:hypothetical protein